MRLIDLSQDIYEGMKVYPGHLKTVQFEHATHEETAPRFEGGFSFQTTGFMLNDNGPTHVDSFSHLDPDPSADTIEKMPLDLFYGTAVCLDVTEFKPQTDITAEDLDRVVAAAPVEVNAGDIVLFHTATWNRYAGRQALPDRVPRPRRVGERVDRRSSGSRPSAWTAPRPDNPASTSYPCHMMCRREHITHYENLANLDQVVNTRFTFVGFPLKLQGAHGGPTRAVAIVD